MKPPKPTSEPMHFPKGFLDGFAVPMLKHSRPVTLRIEGSDQLYFPIFSTREKLKACLLTIEYHEVKRIEDTQEFLEGVNDNLTVIVDLHQTGEGKCSWTQIHDMEDLD